ncbi:MAG: hypothetical protein U0414_39440 [Polyangiaceae bacterium]
MNQPNHVPSDAPPKTESPSAPRGRFDTEPIELEFDDLVPDEDDDLDERSCA